MPNGVITIRRYQLHQRHLPSWVDSKAEICDMHLTTDRKIEDIQGVLQVISLIDGSDSVFDVILG